MRSIHALLLLTTMSVVITASESAQDRECGLIGCLGDTGSGVLVSDTVGANKATAIFQVGTEDEAPYAKEQVTLAPTTKRINQTLVVTFNYDGKRLAAKIPGGLGAFWEIDLQNEESAMLRGVYLDVNGIPMTPTKRDGSHTEFVLGPGAKPPHTIMFNLQFFNASEQFRFSLDDDGGAKFLGPGHDGSPIKDVSAEVDPELPKPDQPPKTFTDVSPREEVDAPKIATSRLAAPEGWRAKRGTWLTPTEIKDRPQDLGGVWLDPDSEAGPELMWLATSPPGTLTDHPVQLRDGHASTLQMKGAGDLQWRGLVHVCPRPAGTCPNLCRWVPGSMQIDTNRLYARGEWHGKKTKSDCSGFENDPDSGPFTMKRFIGVSFVPIVAGKYMQLIGVPAVGSQAAQFKAVVRLAAVYEGTSAANVNATTNRGIINKIEKTSGTYDFVADRSGIAELKFELVGDDGRVFHTDRVRIEIPAIPGLGN